MAATPRPAAYDTAATMGGLYGDGIIACKAAFERDWIAALAQDIDAVFQEALALPGGAVPRGPNRYYVETFPERLRGFVDLATHPWIVAVCEDVLGPDYRIVEIGFDIPGPGARNQPWHRDFPAPPATVVGRRLDSLAFNLTTVDVTEDMGPLEIAPGTQWEAGAYFEHGMFPPTERAAFYQARAQRRMPQAGDVSARSALTLHRGTANRSNLSRPALVLGVDAPGATNADKHDLQVTRGYFDSLPARVRDHLTCRVVDRLEPIVQKHTIEGLLMGAP